MKTTLLFSTFAAAVCMTAALPSYAADRTISSDYALTADETVDGVLTIEAGATVDLAGHKLTVAGLAGAGTVTSSVAAVYRRLEYLESGGAPYINTGYTPVSATTAELRLRFTGNLPANNGNWKTVFGTRKTGSGNNATWFGVFLYKQNNNVYFWKSLRGDDDHVVTGNGIVATGVDYYLKLDKDGTSQINGRDFGSGLSGNCSYPALLFAMNQNGSPWNGTSGGAGQRLYYCRFAENGTTVHDFVPAKRLSDGVLGMYDCTTGDFKTNAGSGTFTGGPERAERALATGELHLAASAGAGAWDCAQIKVAPNVAVVADGGTFAADADWRALGTVFTTTGEVLDLGGHALKVSGIDGAGTVTDESAYEYLDYIQGSGTQYINTGYTMGSGTTADFKAQFQDKPGNGLWHGVFGQRAGGSDKAGACVFLYTTGGNTTFWKTLNGDANTSLAAATDTDYTFHISKTGTASTVTGGSFDNATLGTATTTACSGPAYIFNLNQNGSVWNASYCAKMRLYYLTFAENGTITRNFVPARRTTDSAVGLYDTIGHRFYANSGSGAFTAGTVTNAAASSVLGELHVDVPAGKECENKGVSVIGNVKLVKSGDGSFIAAKRNQLYVGGTVVEDGEFHCASCNNDYFYGASGSEVTIEEGAVLDFDGNGNQHTMKFVLAGGEIRSAHDHGMSGYAWLSNLRLTANSKISGNAYGFVHGSSAAMTVNLGGYTLTIDVTPGKEFYVANTTFTGGGRVVANTGGWIDLGAYSKPCTFADGVTLDIRGAAVNALATTSAGTYESKCAQNYDKGSALIEVTGCFRPYTALFHSTLMKNGSTLDLNQLSGTLVTPCYFSSSRVNGTLTFESGATVTVDISGRTPQLYEKLVAWPVRPEGVTFQFDAATAAGDVPIVVASDGIYYGADPDSQVVDSAWWTGAAGDGDISNTDNWACSNAAGRVIADALPGSLADVRITGDVALQVPPGQTIANRTLVVGNYTLTADCDWRGLGSAAAFNGTIDLNGHKLKVSALPGTGTITDTSKGYAALQYIQGTGTQYINTGYTMNSGTADFKAQFTATPTDNHWHGVFGMRSTSSEKAALCVFVSDYQSKGTAYFWKTMSGQDVKVTDLGVVALNTDYTFHLDKSGHGPCTITGGSLTNATLGTATAGTSTAGPAYIFNLKQGNGVWDANRCARMRLYYLTFSENGEVVCDFVPAKRLSDGVLGLYDKIGKQFRANAGSGSSRPSPRRTWAARSSPRERRGLMTRRAILTSHTAATESKAFGPGIVAVTNGAVFDVRANYAYYGVRSDSGLFLRLDGGTFASSGPHDMGVTSNGGSGIGALTANSSLDVPRSIVFQGGACDLGGHTLTVTIASGKSWHIRNTSFANGRIETRTTGWLHVVTATDASTVDFKVNSAMQIDAQFDVGGYEPDWSGATTHKGTGKMNVHGVFKPAAHDFFYGCTLLDGSTIDLANRTTPLPMVSTFTDTGKKDLEFAANATIKVRKGEKGGKVIAWTEETKPSTYDTLSFVRDPSDTRSYTVQKRDDGVYILTGMTLYVR